MKPEYIGIAIYIIGYCTMLYLVKRENSWFYEPDSKGWYIACLGWFLVVALPIVYILELAHNKLKKTKN